MRESNPERDRVAAAVARLESAVDDLVSEAGERAAGYVERATEHLKRERYHRPPPREPAWLWSDEPRSRKLYRDKGKGKILGVCAGVARYYGLETWVVRCLAVTALIFFNWVAFVTYIVASLILDVDSRKEDGRRRSTSAGGRAEARVAAARGRQRAPSPRHQLRDVHADFDEIELRLRRMESHVTSGQYELQRELAKIGTPSQENR